MASIANDPGGRRRVLFVDPSGDRKAIRLGKVPQRAAEAVRFRVEQLRAAKLTGHALEADTAGWIADLELKMADKLARVGLMPKREAKAAATLGEFVESYIARRADVSPHTLRIWRQTARRLSEHFGVKKPLGEITRGDATDWRLSLVASELADASVRKHCGFAKHFFAQAVDHELIPVNPFAKLVSAPVGNAARQYFVTRDETARILAAAPDAEWRLIIALSRFGGLRCPSEHLALTWADVDWESNRMTVHSSKTARHAGHESRVVPLFQELRPYLEAVFDAAEPGTESVITRYRADSNLRSQMKRIIKRAGLTPWPRITHNLRASRATELAADYPSHVAAAWLGHSTLVAQKHYWTVTDADYERAARDGGAESGARVARNAAQHAHAGNRGGPHEQRATDCDRVTCAKSSESPRIAEKKMAEVHGNRTHRRCGSRTARRF